MNGQEYKNAFGKAPESFKNRVAYTLTHMEEERKVKKFSLRLVLIAGIVLILMAGVVYAASTEWRLFNFFSGMYGRTPGDELQKAIEGNNIARSYETEKLTVDLTEAIADGKYMYLTAVIKPKPGQKLLLLPMDAMPDDSVAMWTGRPGVVSKPEDKNRTFLQLAKEEGKKLVAVNLWYQSGDISNDLADFIQLPDGGVSFVVGGTMVTDASKLPVSLIMTEQELTEEGEYLADTQTKETFAFDLAVTPPITQKTVTGNQIKVQNAGASIDRVQLTLTPLTLHYEIYFTKVDGSVPAYENTLWFRFLGEDGVEIPGGLSLTGGLESKDDVHFVQTGSLLLQNMPYSICLQGYNQDTKEVYGTMELPAE